MNPISCSLYSNRPVESSLSTSAPLKSLPWQKGDWSLALSIRRSPSFGASSWSWNLKIPKTRTCIQQCTSSLRSEQLLSDCKGFTVSCGFKVSCLCFPAGLHLWPLLDPIGSSAQTGDRQRRPSSCSEIYYNSRRKKSNYMILYFILHPTTVQDINRHIRYLICTVYNILDTLHIIQNYKMDIQIHVQNYKMDIQIHATVLILHYLGSCVALHQSHGIF